ncbi:hypothetical protein OPQ81_004051 [Rhizoctonia solani]|nr:hypothetical protein OPQ81_004051 [Rhizoctonia solani]
MPLPPALELGLMPQTHEQSLHRGVICKYITDSPEDYETDRLAEPFGSPYDPAVTRATRGPITDGHPVPPAPKLEPIQRPISNRAIPESNMRDFRKDYLAQQFAAHRPAVEQAGLIGAPPGLPPIVPENQHAYNYRDQPSSHLPASSHLYPPTSACDAYRPHDTTPSSYGQGNPPLPTVEQLLEGVPVPTWEQLDTLSRQIKELYALRALLDPHGHRLRTHVPVLPNIPSKEHRIWGGPVPLVRESSRVEGVVDNDWNSLGDASQDHPPTRPYETQALVLPEISPLCLDEFRIPTPVTVVGEPLFEDPLGDQALEPDDSDDASTQCQLDPNEVSITEVSQAWDKLNDVMVQVRISCDTFVYPSKLDFIPAHGSDDEPLVNQRSLRNKAFINHWEFLYRSLDKLNQMEPLSDRMFFGIRRAVNEVDYELEKLEEFATKLWKKECQEKERRRFWRNVFSSEYDDDEWF